MSLAPEPVDLDAAFLAGLGARVRQRRKGHKLSRRALAATSGVSERYLVELESGRGNISILLLRQVAQALGVRIETLVSDGGAATDHGKAERIALIGLRGAGKSTLGRLLAEDLTVPFIELNAAISRESGLALTEIFSLYGADGYRRFEQHCLDQIVSQYDKCVLAVGGGIVAQNSTFATLLKNFRTVWIQTSPDEHMNRVRAQGDNRPMAGNPAAMNDLRAILADRQRLYARADAALDTAGCTVSESRAALLSVVRSL